MQDQVVTTIFKNLCMVQNVPNAIQFFNAKYAEGRNFHKVLRTYLFQKGAYLPKCLPIRWHYYHVRWKTYTMYLSLILRPRPSLIDK